MNARRFLPTSLAVFALACLLRFPDTVAEALRSFADYRMLIYAVVLILVMLTTNNPTLRALPTKLRRRFRTFRRSCSGFASGCSFSASSIRSEPNISLLILVDRT